MKFLLISALALSAAASCLGQTMPSMSAATPSHAEHLGSVSFPVSCAASQQAGFSRGVALLHDFWYAEAKSQFEQIAKDDPRCAMADWGMAMSIWHQIWERPGEETRKQGWAAIERAQQKHAGTAREQGYIAALAKVYTPGPEQYLARARDYSAAMGALSRAHPEDVDAGAFFALSLLAEREPDDTTLSREREALKVLKPLFAAHPDNPGVDHYIIHACDNPPMAADGLAAADHYGEIAPSGAHAVHMSGHIYARLGMWREDIESQRASIAASEAAESRGEDGLMDEPHSYDFLMYAYLQSGEDAKAKQVLASIPPLMGRLAAMPEAGGHRRGMVAYYSSKFPVFYSLEMRDWQSAQALKPPPGALPEIETLTWWAHAIADGHLRHPDQAQADLARYDALMAEVKKGEHAYYAESTGAAINRSQIAAWASLAAGKNDDALRQMREAADLQDKVGQDEVDIPAREMLGDMLLELGHAQQALAEYRLAIKLSPGRFNGLYSAGRAAEAAGQKEEASTYYAALLKSTAGAAPERPEIGHARSFLSATQLADKQASAPPTRP